MKAILLKLLCVSASLAGLYGCSSDDSGNNGSGSNGTPEIAGKYTLVSMRSNISVDLNNDGVLSTNLFTEIEDSGSTQTDLEIKPVFFNNELVQLMEFYLPHPTLTFDNPKEPEGSVDYTAKGLGYQYQYNNNTNVITVDNNDSGSVPSSGQLDTIEVAGTDQLQAVFEKYYYDFAINEWRLLTITCRYVRT